MVDIPTYRVVLSWLLSGLLLLQYVPLGQLLGVHGSHHAHCNAENCQCSGLMQCNHSPGASRAHAMLHMGTQEHMHDEGHGGAHASDRDAHAEHSSTSHQTHIIDVQAAIQFDESAYITPIGEENAHNQCDTNTLIVPFILLIDKVIASPGQEAEICPSNTSFISHIKTWATNLFAYEHFHPPRFT